MSWRQKRSAVRADPTFGAALGRIQDIIYLGGYGLPLQRRGHYDLLFYEQGLSVVPAAQARVAYSDLSEITPTGPGVIRSGPTFIGGGFGLQGAAEGMAIAALFNQLAVRTKIQTILHIVGTNTEMFLLTDTVTPTQLTIELSPIRSRLQGRSQDAAKEGLSSEIAHLADLHAQGALTEAEFPLAKQKLLGTA